MQSIYIPHLLNAEGQRRTLTFNTSILDLATLTPVRGQLVVQHCQTYLDVQAQAETIVTLTCDRCLQQYNHRLRLDASEMLWLEERPEPATEPLEREVPVEELMETLSPRGHFDPTTWLYEQLCLALPQRQICDDQCQGIAIDATDDPQASPPPTDHRWAALAALKQQFPDA